jgi:hypothetical protein
VTSLSLHNNPLTLDEATEFVLDLRVAVKQNDIKGFMQLCSRIELWLNPDKIHYDVIEKLVSVGAGEVVIGAWNLWGMASSDVACHVCTVVVVLAESAGNRTKLGSIGGCEVVIDALRAFGKTKPTVAENGCCAVGILAADDKNISKLGSIGGCEAVIDALRAFGKTDPEVAESGCWAVGMLAAKITI